MITRKHFEKTACLIKGFTAINEDLRYHMALEFSNMYAEMNPRFNRETFIKACGIGISEV